ncbi:MAG: FG-GAP repeat protein [Ignavibacteria bacterium]|nr:FG-GAP repeat protein [Ignavibacteria bacterium]
MKTIEDWSVELQFKNYELVINNSKSFAAGNKAMLENEKIRIDYTNTKEGMRQDFIVKEKPAGDEDLQLIMDVSTKLKMNVTKDAVTFRSKKDGSDKMHYSSLKAWDANGKILNAYFDKQNDRQFAIRVIDKDAQYPVTVDPLSSTPDWVKESNSENAAFGISVSTAGDVNGDGYDDVLIGAHMFSGEYVNQGKAYLFYGSSTGLNTDPAWTSLGTSEKRYLGKKVSAAGDVNNDGYSDVLIVASARTYGYPTGAVYAFYGSPSGLSSVPGWTKLDF